jgi:hypothetical protein
VTATSLLILVPWLVFAAGLIAIGLRLLILRRGRRDRGLAGLSRLCGGRLRPASILTR